MPETKKTAAPKPAEKKAVAGTEKELAAPSGRRIWPWLLLIALIITAATAVFILGQQPVWLQDVFRQHQAEPAPPATAVAGKQAVVPAGREAATAEAVAALQKEMQQLQERLAAIAEEQRQWRQAAAEAQRLNLRLLLGQIADADSTPSLMHLNWNQIALMPQLPESEREEAAKLGGQAEAMAKNVDSWRSTLHQLAASLPVADEEAAVEPAPAAPAWLKPIFRYIRITPSPRKQDEMRQLRMQLLQNSHLLALGLWPDARAWQQQRKLAAVGGDETLAASLPEDFADTRLKLQELRKAAADWLERL